MVKAVGYVRVSKEEQAEKDLSIPAQKAKIISYCQSQDWDLIDIYVDDGYSAKDLERPEIRRLIRDCKKKEFEAVIVVKLDRISRNQKDILYLLEDVFAPHNIGFKSVTQSFDTTTAFGKAAIGMLAVFAQLEREQLIERVQDAKKEAAKQGRYMGGPVPLGYKYNRMAKSIEIDAAQAEIVRLIYEKYLTNEIGCQALAELLDKENFRPPKAKHWSHTAVHKILTNPFYAGFIAHKGQLYKGQHPAIIEPDKWQQVQSIMSSRNKYLPAGRSGLVSGLVICGECGAKMRTKNVWQNYPRTDPKKIIRYYVCYSQDGSVPYLVKDPNCRCGYKHADEIDKEVVRQLMNISINQRLINKVARELAESDPATTNSRAMVSIKREYESVQKRLNRWYDAFEQGALTPDELMDRIRELRERKAILEQRLEAYEAAIEAHAEYTQSVDSFIALLRNFKVLWQEATYEEKKAIVTNLVQAVTVFADGRVKISLYPH